MKFINSFFKKLNLKKTKPLGSFIKIYYEGNIATFDTENKKINGLLPVYYWDSVPNFGDVIGPYLISKITGKPIININNLNYSGIMAVGSIIQMLDREGMIIWGSGLIFEPNEKLKEDIQQYKPKILSVRGNKTAQCLIEAGISVPEQKYYGDPALVLPLFYTPSVNIHKKIGICPHYIHKEYFLEKNINQYDFLIIDVQQNMEFVIDSIASSAVCISSSLHGLIIAQAYQIPWVWLEIYDNNLTGDDFKFQDFFSTIDQSNVSHLRVKMEDIPKLDFKSIANKATLPNKLYNEKLILEPLIQYLESINYD